MRSIHALLVLLAVSALIISGCGGGGGGGGEGISVSISLSPPPTESTVVGGREYQCIATVTGTTDQSVDWSATKGSITTAGVFTPPHEDTSTIVKATSVADPSKSAEVLLTVADAPPPPPFDF